MHKCPGCSNELDVDFLNPIMDKLALNKKSGEVLTNCPNCELPLRAYSRVMQYYLEPADGSAKPVMIGAA
ncbi:MAG TPA: hypothetical protein VL178_07565 [Pseudomonas sp.]|nr:hypothetical protein [Pseudomonas sp.]